MKLSKEDRESLLGIYQSLRVADVRDGMDCLMLHHQGSMDPAIRPLWRTTACGIARTARYVPFKGKIPETDPEKYFEWSGWYYSQVCPYPFMNGIEKGDMVVIDMSGIDVGLMGSNNSLGGIRAGAAGYIVNGGVRDTDELILQKVPFWSRMVSKSMVQGRIQYDAHDVPVEVGGVTVRPGDMIVADGDGVMVVPLEDARKVAKYADEEHKRDMKGRADHYKALGMKLDRTVEGGK